MLNSYDASQFQDSIGRIAFDPVHHLLAGISVATPDTVNLHDLSDINAGPVLLQAIRIPTDNANTLYQGAIDFGGGSLFALDTNNGLTAYALPLLSINRMGGNVVVSWPTTLTGFALQYTTNLGGIWPSASGNVVSGDRYTPSAPGSGQFFRLFIGQQKE